MDSCVSSLSCRAVSPPESAASCEAPAAPPSGAAPTAPHSLCGCKRSRQFRNHGPVHVAESASCRSAEKLEFRPSFPPSPDANLFKNPGGPHPVRTRFSPEPPCWVFHSDWSLGFCRKVYFHFGPLCSCREPESVEGLAQRAAAPSYGSEPAKA